MGVGLVIGRIHGKRIKFAFYEEQFLVPEEKNREGSSISQTIRAESFTRATPLPPLPLPLHLAADFIHFPPRRSNGRNLLIPREDPAGERSDTGSGEICKLERYKTYPAPPLALKERGGKESFRCARRKAQLEETLSLRG